MSYSKTMFAKLITCSAAGLFVYGVIGMDVSSVDAPQSAPQERTLLVSHGANVKPEAEIDKDDKVTLRYAILRDSDTNLAKADDRNGTSAEQYNRAKRHLPPAPMT